MAVKLLVLKSYEDVIAEVAEISNGLSITHYKLSNPYVTRVDDEKVTYYPYLPLSKDKDIKIPSDWVVTVVDPLDEVTQSYLENLNAKPKNFSIEE